MNVLTRVDFSRGFDNLFHSFNFANFSRGDAWFVDAENGDDNAGGQTIWSPLKTIQKALTLIEAKRAANSKYYDEFIYLLPTNGVNYDDDVIGSKYTGAYVYVNTPNIHIIGAGPLGSVVIKPTAAASNGVFYVSGNADRFHLANVVIDTSASLNGAVKLAAGADYPLIEHVVVNVVGTTGPTGYGINGSTDQVAFPIVRNSVFYLGTLGVAAIYLKAKDTFLSGGLIENNYIVSTLNGSGTGTQYGIAVGDGTGVIVSGNVIHGGDSGTAYNIGTGIIIATGVLNTSVVRNRVSGCDYQYVDSGTDTDLVDNWTADGEGGEFADAEMMLGIAT